MMRRMERRCCRWWLVVYHGRRLVRPVRRAWWRRHARRRVWWQWHERQIQDGNEDRYPNKYDASAGHPPPPPDVELRNVLIGRLNRCVDGSITHREPPPTSSAAQQPRGAGWCGMMPRRERGERMVGALCALRAAARALCRSCECRRIGLGSPTSDLDIPAEAGCRRSRP